jgi:hypothetical protein
VPAFCIFRNQQPTTNDYLGCAVRPPESPALDAPLGVPLELPLFELPLEYPELETDPPEDESLPVDRTPRGDVTVCCPAVPSSPVLDDVVVAEPGVTRVYPRPFTTTPGESAEPIAVPPPPPPILPGTMTVFGYPR